MSNDDRIDQIVADWREARDEGNAPEPDELVRGNPEIADQLRARFDALNALQGAFASADADERETTSTPKEIGDYEIVREIGRGGMGVVYEAIQRKMSRKVALKVLTLGITGTPQAVKRFRREAKAAGMLHHTNIVPVYELDQAAGHWYYAMQLVEGLSLSQVVREMRAGKQQTEEELARLSLSLLGSAPGDTPIRGGTGGRAYFIRVAEMFAGVADALELAHQAGVIHRDIKPSNLLLDADGVLKIVDFGLARFEGDAGSMTMTGDLLGTPNYMSPEQAMAKRMSIDGRTDIYSLGATLYEVLTLRPPFEADNVQQLFSQIITQDPARPRRANKRIPRDLETIVCKAMEKDRDQRYQNARAFARDLRLFAEGGAIQARRISLLGRSWRKVKRHKVRSSLAAALLLFAVVGTGLGIRAAREAALRTELESANIELKYAALCATAEQAAIDAFVLVDRDQYFLEQPRQSLTRGVIYLGDGAERPAALLEKPRQSLIRRVVYLGDGAERPAALFAEAIRLAPDRSEAYLGRALSPGRTLEERLADIDDAHVRGLSARTWHLARGRFLKIAGRDEAAKRERERAADHPGGTPLDVYFEARRLVEASQWADAQLALTQVLSAKETGRALRYLALRVRATVHTRNGDYRLALGDLFRIQELGDEGAVPRANIASALRRMGAEQAAARTFQEALDAARNGNERAWVRFIKSVKSSRESEWLEDATSAALQAHPDSAALVTWRADALRHLGRLDAALEASNKAIDLDPNHSVAFLGRAYVLFELSRYDEALEDCARALQLDPDSVQAYHFRGWVFEAKDMRDKAIASYREAIRTDPYFAASHNNLGSALHAKGQWDQAIASYGEAIRLDPNHVHAHTNLGAALYEKGMLDEGIASYREAIRIDPNHVPAHYNLGNALVAKGQMDEAIASFRKAIRIDPNHADAHYNLGSGLYAKGQMDEAIASFREAIRIDPVAADAHISLGAALYEKGQWDRAIASSLEAIRLDPDEAKAHCNLGSALNAKGQTDEALASFREAIRIDPNRADFHTNLGAALSAKGQLDEAIASQREAIRIDPNHAGAHYNLGNVLQAKGQLDQAIASFREAIRIDPNYADAHTNLGNVLHAKGQLDEAIASYGEAIRIDPNRAKAHYNLGNAFLDKGQMDEAIASYREAIRIDPNYVAAHYNLGNVLEKKGLVDEAIASYHEAIRLDPNKVEAHSNLGKALVAKGQMDEAIVSFREAIRIDPDCALAHGGLGDALSRLGRYDEAIASFREAIRIDPDLVPAHMNLGATLCDRLGRYDEAIASFRDAIRLDPNLARAHSNLGTALRAKGQLDQAIASFREAIRLDPDLARTHNNLGIALHAKGQTDEALASFREAIRIDPNYAGAHSNVGALLQATGRFQEALDSWRRGHDLASRNPRLAQLSAARIKECVVLLELDLKLSQILSGKASPSDPKELLALAKVCRIKKLHAAEAGFWMDALAAEPGLINVPRAFYRYNAACAAALAGAGVGEDKDSLDDDARARFRSQVLAWLRAELAGWKKHVESEDGAMANTARGMMSHSKRDPDLTGIREETEIGKLPASERKAWRSFWAEVDATLASSNAKK